MHARYSYIISTFLRLSWTQKINILQHDIGGPYVNATYQRAFREDQMIINNIRMIC